MYANYNMIHVSSPLFLGRRAVHLCQPGILELARVEIVHGQICKCGGINRQLEVPRSIGKPVHGVPALTQEGLRHKRSAWIGVSVQRLHDKQAGVTVGLTPSCTGTTKGRTPGQFYEDP